LSDTPRIESATHISMDTLCQAMNVSFSDYSVPMHLSPQAFELMMLQRGLHRKTSRIAVVDDRVAAIWLVSVRGKAAYLISSGTVPKFRRRGLARQLAADCLSGLRHRGATSFQTEVLTDNRRAHDLYVSLGMRFARTLDCYDVPVPEEAADDHEVRDVTWPQICRDVLPLHDIEPSWQNATESLTCVADRVTCRAMFDEAGIVGYAATLSDSGTLAQLAVRKDKRRMGIARALISNWPGRTALRVINADRSSSTFRAFMKSLGARQTHAQYELTMTL